MQIIKRGEVTRYAFDARDEPVLHVKQGESFQVETDDALSGLIEDDSDNPKVHQFVGDAHVDALNAAWPPKYNPVVGPIHVEGCEAGDVLAVNLEFIDPWRYGFSGILPGIGPYGESTRWGGQCAEPRVQVIEHLPGPSGKTRDGKGKYSDKLTWDLEPFCGTLATAPEREVFTSLLGQGPFGGNIDCRDVAPGHTILLNSYHEGRTAIHRRHPWWTRRHRVHWNRGRDARHRAVELHRHQEQAQCRRCASSSPRASWRSESTCRWSTPSTTPAPI